MTDRKFPIGRFVLQEAYTKDEIQDLCQIISRIPSEYKQVVANLNDDDLAKTYREGSWNIRQIVHHVADIALLHYLRMKKALTETDQSTLTLIDMDAWSATSDSLEMPIADSLILFEGVSQRYAYLAKGLTEEQFAITYLHPIRNIRFDQKQALGLSVWHTQHHLAHIKLALGD